MAVDTRALADLRRRLKRVEPEVGKQLDRELRATARSVARVAASLSPRRSGALAGAWRPSVTARRGASVRNTKVYAAQHEYGKRVWLRRGYAYRDSTPGTPPTSAATGRGSVKLRQQSLPGGLVVNEAQYTIRRSEPGKKAVVQELPRSLARVEASARAAAERALS